MPMMNAFERAQSLTDAGNFPAAVCEFREHLAEFPSDVRARYEYACCLQSMRQYEAAWTEAERCTKVSKTFGEAWNLLGNLCSPLRHQEDAGAYYAQSLKVAPGSPLTRWNLALWQIGQGLWEVGWNGYQWGVAAGVRPVRTLTPEWNAEALAEKTLFLWAEQGLGDCIMCLQLLKRVREQNPECKIMLEVPAALCRLCRESYLVDLVFATKLDKSLPVSTSFDEHCSLMSLPHILGITPENMPADCAYLKSAENDVNRWSAEIDPYQFNVGIAWQGSPSHSGDADRSMPLKALSPLLSLPCTFYSLQHDYDPELLSQQASEVIPLGHRFKDFADTAAAVSLMDLIITVDTSVAHLAAAMGKRTWNLISAVPDYRWMHKRETTPWYPTMRLFRQEMLGDWAGVIDRVRTDLQELTQCR